MLIYTALLIQRVYRGFEGKKLSQKKRKEKNEKNLTQNKSKNLYYR
jgi:hypothetical protein